MLNAYVIINTILEVLNSYHLINLMEHLDMMKKVFNKNVLKILNKIQSN